jgi:hypothetical protein
MTLADLIDLEAQLARDRDVAAESLEARDRALLAGERLDPARRGPLVARWLARVRAVERGRLFPGRTVASVLGGFRAALAILGLSLGWTAVSGVLRYEGAHPVNVWDFLLAFVFLQVVLVVLLLLSFALPLAATGAPLRGALRGLLGAVYPWLVAAGFAGERAEEWRAVWHRLRARRSLYHRIEPWVLLGLTQVFGVAFNVGALLALVRLVVFSDVAFSWGTTLVQFDAARFHSLVALLAAPFGWAFPDAVPSLALVEATRYSRLDAAYHLAGAGRAAHPELVGGWWPFLVASLACYGLLPRLVTLLVARLRRAHLLARVPLDDVEVTRLVHRLAEPHVETASTAAQAAVPPWPPPVATSEAPGGTRCALVLWRDVPPGPALEAAVRAHTRCEVIGVGTAGGLEFQEGGGDWAPLLGASDRVVVAAEGWEAPDRSVLRFFGELRRAGGPRRHIQVLLLQANGEGVRPASSTQVAVWRDSLARLADPFLVAEPLREGP